MTDNPLGRRISIAVLRKDGPYYSGTTTYFDFPTHARVTRGPGDGEVTLELFQLPLPEELRFPYLDDKDGYPVR